MTGEADCQLNFKNSLASQQEFQMHNCLWSSARAAANNRLSLTHFWVLGLYENGWISVFFFFFFTHWSLKGTTSWKLYYSIFFTIWCGLPFIHSGCNSAQANTHPTVCIEISMENTFKKVQTTMCTKPYTFIHRFHNNIISAYNLYTKQLSRLKAKMYVASYRNIYFFAIASDVKSSIVPQKVSRYSRKVIFYFCSSLFNFTQFY